VRRRSFLQMLGLAPAAAAAAVVAKELPQEFPKELLKEPDFVEEEPDYLEDEELYATAYPSYMDWECTMTCLPDPIPSKPRKRSVR
jgi:hypothetical protein